MPSEGWVRPTIAAPVYGRTVRRCSPGRAKCSSVGLSKIERDRCARFCLRQMVENGRISVDLLSDLV